jgi:hypothetical protein
MYGVYSKPCSARGTLDEWHGAMGFNPHTFSTKGIMGALPISYDRFLTAQATAHWLHRHFDYPVVAPESMGASQMLAFDQWQSSGCSPCSGGPEDSGDDGAPVLAAISSEANDTSADRDARAPGRTDPSLGTLLPHPAPLADKVDAVKLSPYTVTRAEQSRDPALHTLISQLESGRNRAGVVAQLSRTYEMRDGLLWRHSVSREGEHCLKLMVPRHGVGPLLRRFHFSSHRGHEPLYEEVSESYHWDGIKQDCATFTSACSVCGATKSRNLVKAPVIPIPTPSRPFEVIHLDHKGPLRRSGGYTNVLVVVCALTRFTLYIPVTSTTGEETVKALIARVFAIFGFRW